MITVSSYSYFLFVYFLHFDFKDSIKYTAIYLFKFLHFLWKTFFPGQTPVPPRSVTWILDLSHDPIWAIWLAEVRKFHQHHDRILDYVCFMMTFLWHIRQPVANYPDELWSIFNLYPYLIPCLSLTETDNPLLWRTNLHTLGDNLLLTTSVSWGPCCDIFNDLALTNSMSYFPSSTLL